MAHQISVVAMSEADIPAASRVRFALEWKHHGWHVTLSEPEQGLCKVALLCRVQSKSINLCTEDGRTRNASALLDLRGPCGAEPLLITAVYLQSGACATAQAQAQDIISGALASRRKCVIIGDFNLEQHEGDIAMLLQQGIVRACDEAARGSQLPATGPRHSGIRRRRIDYALAVGDLFATRVDHLDDSEIDPLSDHKAVVYAFDLLSTPILKGPHRRLPAPDGVKVDEDFQFDSNAISLFRSLLSADDLDAAWKWLSDVAENLVCEPARQDHAVPRSSQWNPARRRVREDSCPDTAQSPGLRALRKLLTRLQLCIQKPWDSALQVATSHTIAPLRRMVPELPHITCGCIADIGAVCSIIDAYAADEKQAHTTRWKQIISPDPAGVRAFVKRRAELSLDWERSPEPACSVGDGWHPVSLLKFRGSFGLTNGSGKRPPTWTACIGFWMPCLGHHPAMCSWALLLVSSKLLCTPCAIRLVDQTTGSPVTC